MDSGASPDNGTERVKPENEQGRQETGREATKQNISTYLSLYQEVLSIGHLQIQMTSVTEACYGGQDTIVIRRERAVVFVVVGSGCYAIRERA